MKKDKEQFEGFDHLNVMERVSTNGLGIFKYLKLFGELSGKSLIIKNGNVGIFDSKKESEAIEIVKLDLQENLISYRPFGTVVFYNYGSARKDKIAFESSHYFDELSKAIRIATNKNCKCVYHLSYNKAEKPTKFYKPYDFIDNDDNFSFNNDSYIKNKKDLRIINSIFKSLIKLPIDNGVNHTPLLNAVRFLNHAQNEHWLSLKITLFFIALESLFSTDNNEISFKVSLRASYFLYSKNKEKRSRVFNILRNGYDLRSGFVHGLKKDEHKIAQKLKKGSSDYSMMIDFPEELNSMVCDIVNKILTTETLFKLFSSGNKNEIENYLSSLVI